MPTRVRGGLPVGWVGWVAGLLACGRCGAPSLAAQMSSNYPQRNEQPPLAYIRNNVAPRRAPHATFLHDCNFMIKPNGWCSPPISSRSSMLM
jgi:hypothetical protein